ncbi:MAG: hypothetical protein ACRC36_20185 [Lacrimispora sphenoides]
MLEFAGSDASRPHKIGHVEMYYGNGIICGHGIPEPVILSGWNQEPDGWRFYLGNTGEPIRDTWYLDSDGKWYWFNAAGIMVTNTWYQYNQILFGTGWSHVSVAACCKLREDLCGRG